MALVWIKSLAFLWDIPSKAEWVQHRVATHTHTHLCSHYSATSTNTWGTPIHKMAKNAWWKSHTHYYTGYRTTPHLLGGDVKLLETLRRSEGLWPLTSNWQRMYEVSWQDGDAWNTLQAHWEHNYANVDTLHKCCKYLISLLSTLIDPRKLPKCVPPDMLFTPDLWTPMN